MVAFYTDDVFFLHIPKNGGTSVCAAFEKKYRLATFPRGHSYEPASFYTEEKDGRYGFAIVRNPWDRIASSYRFVVLKHPYKMFRTQPNIDAPKERKAELRRCREDFDYWLMDFCEKWAYWPNGLARTGRPFTRTPQTYWLDEELDDIWRFEDMNPMWAHLSERFGVTEERKNVTTTPGGRDYRPYYSKRSRDYIGEHFKDDIERWGYSFD